MEPSSGCHCPGNETPPRPAQAAGVARRTPMGPEPQPLLPAYGAAASQMAPACVTPSIWDTLPWARRGSETSCHSRLSPPPRGPLGPLTTAPPLYLSQVTKHTSHFTFLFVCRVSLSLARLKATGGWGPCMFGSPPYTQCPAQGLACSRCSKIMCKTNE